jgi:two-component system, cell cycle response regulator
MRVALVDPSRTVIKMVSRILEAAKHDVVAFVEAREAIERMKSDHTIEALITSAELDTMSGIELVWETRLLATERRPIFIVLMSSNKDHQNIIEALDGGADEFIGKPPFPEELYARLRAGERLLSTQRELVRLATTDPLTGLLNRRACFDAARELCARADAGSPLCAVMMDIDHFKRVNDQYGHDIGDRVLCGVAREAANEAKVAARLGGEEFVLLIEAELANTIRIADNLRAKVAALHFKTNKGTVTTTASFGVSIWKLGDTIDTLLKRADMGLYEAKTGGRNRVVAVDPGAPRSDGPLASGVLRLGPRQMPTG